MTRYPSLPSLAVALLVAGACATGQGASPTPTVPAADAAVGTSPPPTPVADAAAADPAEPAQGVYAEVQAERGRAVFRDVCAECHYSSEFRDRQFRFKWGRRTVRDLYREIVRNMPEDDPGSLADQEYVDIVSYILQLNGFPPGSAELPVDLEIMAGYPLTPPPSGGTD